MKSIEHNPWLHRVAVLTACVALLPIFMGALVTTRDAGMAFPDWPTSDGQGMLSYPWLKSHGAKFLEHGHRLAGMLIGLASIVLVYVAWRDERRSWARRLAYAVLLGVIAQGLLGGLRVLRDQRELAFVHGSFAALILALMAGVAVVTSAGWREAASESRQGLRRLRLVAYIACACVFAQYVLGGLLRHQGRVLYEHVGFAFVTALVVVWLAISAASSGNNWLRGPAAAAALLVVSQLVLGAAAWVTKFGWGEHVAVYGSLSQDVFRTGHVLCGALLFMTTVVLAVRILRLDGVSSGKLMDRSPNPRFDASLPLAGGAR